MAMNPNWFSTTDGMYTNEGGENRPVTQADQDAWAAQEQQMQQSFRDQIQQRIDAWRGQGDPLLGDLFNAGDYQGATTRGTPGVDEQGLYNWGDGLQSWVPMGDSRFVPAPQHNDSFTSGGGFLGGIVGTTKTHLEDTAHAYEKDPERAVLGINTPGESQAWGTLLGKHYDPTITQTGGPTQTTYNNAEQSGYSTGPTETGHTLAPAIVGIGAAGALAGGGTLVGGEGTATLAGGAGTDTLAGSTFVGDIPIAGEGGTSIYGTAGTTAGTGTTATAGAGTTGASQLGSGGSGTTSSTGSTSGVNTMSDGIDPSMITDPSYWNPEGGTTGLAEPGATGFDPGTSTYGGDGTLVNSQTVQEVARQLGITPAAALKYLMSAGGGLVGAGLGIAGSRRQQGQLEALNNQYLGFGAPSRARYEASFAPGFTMANDPGYKDALDMVTKSTLHGLSVTGNPAGSPNAWDKTLSDVNAKFAYPALQNYRNQNANTGGIGQLTAAAPAAATGAIAAGGNVFNAAGAAVNDIFSPPKSLAQQLAELRMVA